MGTPYEDRTAKLGGFNDNMDIFSVDPGRNDLNLGLDLEYNLNDKFLIYAEYNTGILEDNKDQNIGIGAKFTF